MWGLFTDHTSASDTLRQTPDGGYRITSTVASRCWVTEPIISHLTLDDVGPATAGMSAMAEVLLKCCHRLALKRRTGLGRGRNLFVCGKRPCRKGILGMSQAR